MNSFRQKPREAEVRKRGRELVRAIERMSDAANLQVVSWARPSTKAMVRAAERFRAVRPANAPERSALDRMIATGRDMLAAIDVDQARLEVAAVSLLSAVEELDRVYAGV